MKKYITPIAKIVDMEVTDIVTASEFSEEKGVLFSDLFE